MFKNAKVGDRVYDYEKDCWGTITEVNACYIYPITVKFDDENFAKCSYTIGGKTLHEYANPVLFWNKISFETPKQPFSLENELRKLKIKEFINDKNNFYLVWHSKKDSISCEYRSYAQQPFGKYFTEESIKSFLDNIKDKKITKEQFFRTYKNVFGGRINE